MNDTTMTVRGNLVESPTLRRTKNGLSVANFRLASTPRRFDRASGQWVDGDTLFVTVTAWRALAENVAASLVKGQPVVVYGRYCQRYWTTPDDQPRSAYELEADSVGHDLARGVTSFEKVQRATPAVVDLDENGMPTDASRDYLDLADDGEVAGGVLTDGVDRVTGEVREPQPA